MAVSRHLAGVKPFVWEAAIFDCAALFAAILRAAVELFMEMAYPTLTKVDAGPAPGPNLLAPSLMKATRSSSLGY